MKKTFWVLLVCFVAVLFVSLGAMDFSAQVVKTQLSEKSVQEGNEDTQRMASLGQIESLDLKSELPTYGDAPKFQFENFQGEIVSDEDVRGEPWVVSFFFTKCPHVCPTINARISTLSKRFENRSVRFISVSVDPENDTPEALREYALKYHANPNRWQLLRGELQKVFTFMHDGLKLGSGSLPNIHTTRVTLIDQNNKIRGYYHGLDSRSMAKLGDDIDGLLSRTQL